MWTSQSGSATVTQADSEVRLRADAEENRKRILGAAREVFAEDGLAATTDQIAVRAGVGKGTLYRRFGSKQALLDAVLDDLTAQFEDLVPPESVETGPRSSLKVFVIEAAAFYCRHAGFFETVVTGRGEQELPSELRDRLSSACERSLRPAQEAGDVREDLSSVDVLRLIKMLAATGRVEDPNSTNKDLSRYADLLFEGIARANPDQRRNPCSETAEAPRSIARTAAGRYPR